MGIWSEKTTKNKVNTHSQQFSFERLKERLAKQERYFAAYYNEQGEDCSIHYGGHFYKFSSIIDGLEMPISENGKATLYIHNLMLDDKRGREIFGKVDGGFAKKTSQMRSDIIETLKKLKVYLILNWKIWVI